MTTRLLPHDEWHRLEATSVGALWSQLPHSAQVVVVEDDAGALVGSWVVMPVVHVEFLWIAEPHRKRTSVARRLWTAMRAVVRGEFGAARVWTASVDDQVAQLLAHAHAERVPGDHWMLSVGVGE